MKRIMNMKIFLHCGDLVMTHHYNTNNFVGALHRIEQFHNENLEASKPLVTGETTDLAESLPEG